MTKSTYFHVFTFLFFFLAAVASVTSEVCVYTILVKTGTVGGAGSNSKMSCILKDAQGSQVVVSNLETYGRMGAKHDYFEKGNLDTFTVETTCMESSVCSLTLTSDGTGYKAGWYVDYVQVLTTKGSQKAGDNIMFEVYGWLALDEPPYSLTRLFNRCPPAILQQNAII